MAQKREILLGVPTLGFGTPKNFSAEALKSDIGFLRFSCRGRDAAPDARKGPGRSGGRRLSGCP
jgi:hypothetical protein